MEQVKLPLMKDIVMFVLLVAAMADKLMLMAWHEIYPWNTSNLILGGFGIVVVVPTSVICLLVIVN